MIEDTTAHGSRKNSGSMVLRSTREPQILFSHRFPILILGVFLGVLLFPSVGLGFSDSESFMVNAIGDALALGPEQLRFAKFNNPQSLKKAISKIRTKTQNGRRNPDEHFEAAVSAYKNPAKTEYQRFEELVALSIYLIDAVRPRCSAKFFMDLGRSPAVFITEFDGMQPLSGKYSAFLSRTKEWAGPYKKKLGGACRIYNPRNAKVSADNTAIFFNFVVNGLVDVWGGVLERGGVLKTTAQNPGTALSQDTSGVIMTQIYKPSESLDIASPLGDFRKKEPARPGRAPAPAVLAKVTPTTTTTTIPATTTTVTTTTSPATTTVTTTTVAPTTSVTTTTMVVIAMTTPTTRTPTTTAPSPPTTTVPPKKEPPKKKPVPPPVVEEDEGEDIMVFEGLEITSSDTASLTEHNHADALGIGSDLGEGAVPDISQGAGGVINNSGAGSQIARSGKTEHEIESGQIDVALGESIGRAEDISIGDKRKHRIILGSVTDLDESETTGSINPKVLISVIRRNLGGIRSCYERLLKFNPNLSGRFYVEIAVGIDGTVTNVDVLEDSINDSDLSKCLVKKIYQWKFPPPSGGPFTFSYPFTFVQSL